VETEAQGHWNLRVSTIRDTLPLVLARPWFGWGAGSFGAVFPIYQGDYGRNAKGEITSRWNQAHCDWLQIPAEFGLAGLALFVTSAGLAARRAILAGGPRTRWVLLGCGMVAADALADFPFQNPAVLLLWTVMLVTAGCAGRTRNPADEPQAISRGRGQKSRAACNPLRISFCQYGLVPFNP
jgi:O-antigen ligase